jgi:hypothetical protein
MTLVKWLFQMTLALLVVETKLREIRGQERERSNRRATVV